MHLMNIENDQDCVLLLTMIMMTRTKTMMMMIMITNTITLNLMVLNTEILGIRDVLFCNTFFPSTELIKNLNTIPGGFLFCDYTPAKCLVVIGLMIHPQLQL